MTRQTVESAGSVAAIAGHPIHPMLVPFPIAAVFGMLASDLAFYATGNAFWAEAALWLHRAALATGLLAALPGLVDLVSLVRARHSGFALAHGLGNVLLLAVLFVGLILRGGDPQANGAPFGVVLSSVSTLLLLITGWLGGELVYRRGIGVDRQVVASEHVPGYRADPEAYEAERANLEERQSLGDRAVAEAADREALPKRMAGGRRR